MRRTRSTEVVSIRVPTAMYLEIIRRAKLKQQTVTEWGKNALAKYMDYKEDKDDKTSD